MAGVGDSSKILPGLLLHGNTWLSKLLKVTFVIFWKKSGYWPWVVLDCE